MSAGLSAEGVHSPTVLRVEQQPDVGQERVDFADELAGQLDTIRHYIEPAAAAAGTQSPRRTSRSTGPAG